MMTENKQDWVRWQGRALALGVAGLVLCGAGAWFRPAPFFRSYLVAFNFWLGIALGSLAIVMLYHLTGGGWGLVIRRLLESATQTLPWLALLFIPLLFGLHEIYSWANPDEFARAAILGNKSRFLNVPFFEIRAGIYFAVWLALAYLVNKWSRDQDQSGDPRYLRRFRLLSGPGLILYGLTITFASVDWVMSLDPQWFSTIFALVFAVGQILAAFAFVIGAAVLLAARPPLADLVSPQLFNDLGNLLLTFTMVWAYVAFSQFLITWSGNLPEEIRWYLPRFQEGWQWLGIALVLCQLALPFLLLLSRTVKRTAGYLARVAALILVMRFVDLLWQIIPAFPPSNLLGHGWDFAAALVAMLGIGGIWLAVFLRQLDKWPLVPVHDPVLAEVIHHD
ncbi:MAG TPA: hypothetical protein VGY77_00515 [Gemmataceae bacterium]|jgi:hypothetical protein|nr:hypothetical protein [Gemmataceae bacterium]